MKARVELFDVFHRQFDDGQVAQAEKVELDQADGFHVVLVELGHRHCLGAGGHVQRAEVGQLARRDQHAAGVHADVAGHAFELARQLEQLAHFLLVVVALLELGHFVQRLVEA